MSDPTPNNSKDILFLQEISIETTTSSTFDLELKNGDRVLRLQKEGDARAYALTPGLKVLDISDLSLTAIGHYKLSIKKRSIARPEARITFTGQKLMEELRNNENLLSVETTFHKHPFKVTFLFQSSSAAENTRKVTQKLQAAIKDYKPMLSDAVLKGIDPVLGIGVAFAELNPISQAAFGIAEKIFELLKEQQEYDAMVTDLAEGISEILPYANAAIEEDVSEVADSDLVKVVTKLYTLVGETAGYLLGYVKHGRAYRIAKSLVSQDTAKIKELAEDFTKMKENFDRALSVEALKITRTIDDRLILERLKPAAHAGYKEDLKCMEGTRKKVLGNVMKWAMSSAGEEQIYWIHGIPGLGKTALATSISLELHRVHRLGGSFFCRRDDPILNKPSSVLPALIYRLHSAQDHISLTKNH